MSPITFYHNPMSRSAIVSWMLEECEAQYELKLMSWETGDQKSPGYLALNPMGKVPAILHEGIVVTETPAILAYLADIFPEQGLAPKVGDANRGTYYRWLFFAAGCVEPAATDKALDRLRPDKAGVIGYGSYETTFEVLEEALQKAPYLVNDQFSAADVYMASQLSFGIQFKTIEKRKVFSDYIERCHNRPAQKRAAEKNAALIEEQKKGRSKS